MEDSSLLYRLWGKTNERDRKRNPDDPWRMHPAMCHLVDVGYVAETWLKISPTLLDRFHLFAPEIDREELRKIIITLVALHDLGKLHVSFQSKSEEGWNYGYGSIGKARSTHYKGFDHGRATSIIIRKLVDGERRSWRKWRKAFDMVSGHHGRLYSQSELRGYTSETFPPFIGEHAIVVQAIEVLTNLFEFPDNLPAPPHDNSFYLLLAGFCSVADWLGSNSEIYTFASRPLQSASDLRAYLQNLRDRNVADQQLGEAGLLSSFVDTSLNYDQLFSFTSIRPLQEISCTIPFGQEAGPEIVVVEAPMGMGKTEIALYLAAQAIGSRNAEGIYFALPTQASSNALLDRVHSFASSVRHPDGDVSLVLAHGGKKFNKQYGQIKRETWRHGYERARTRSAAGKQFDDETVPSEVVAPDWLQPTKQSLLAGIGVGTIDQAMLGSIEVRHAFVRLFALSNKVVIFDEIHAYDSYMNEIIIRLLEWLHALGTKVILLSATLPRRLRTDLLATYNCGLYTSDRLPEHDPYPQILYGYHSGQIRSYDVEGIDESPEESRKSISITPHPGNNEERTRLGGSLAVELALRGGCIAWIRNTVREAQEAWQEIVRLIEAESHHNIEVTLLHARFTRADRNEIESVLIDRLGKSQTADRPKKMIVIATQVIEQSVDIDFDAMISDLAPIDLLLQRLGRMWRHDRDPSVRHGHTSPVLHVLTPSQEEHMEMQFGSSHWVYDDDTLARSACLVAESTTWKLPDDCRRLVALLYDHDEDWTAERMSVNHEKLEEVRSRGGSKNDSEQSSARQILMSSPEVRDLQMREAMRDDDKGDRIQLATRIGGASATVVLLEDNDGAIYFSGTDTPVSPLPADDNIKGLLQLDEAVLLASVSFPWWNRLEPDPDGPATVTALDAWWRDRRPYDNKIFLLLNKDGEFDHPQIRGRYRRDAGGRAVEGLVVEKKTEDSLSSNQDKDLG